MAAVSASRGETMAPVALIAEGGISAMKRSKYLVKGHFAKAFILLVLVYVAIALITEIVSFSVSH